MFCRKATEKAIDSSPSQIGFADIRVMKWQGMLVTEGENPDGGQTLVIKTVVANNLQLIAIGEKLGMCGERRERTGKRTHTCRDGNIAGIAAQRKELDATTQLTDPELEDEIHGLSKGQLVGLVDLVDVRIRVLRIRRIQATFTIRARLTGSGRLLPSGVRLPTTYRRRRSSTGRPDQSSYGIERNLEDIKRTSDLDILISGRPSELISVATINHR